MLTTELQDTMLGEMQRYVNLGPVAPDWDDLVGDANRWSMDYTTQISQGIADNSNRIVSDIVRDARESGQSQAELARRLTWRFGRAHAEMVAITETTRADAEAATVLQNRLGEMGVRTQRRWLTGEDEKVCAICAPFDHATAEIGQPFTATNGRQAMNPPLHPRCRCQVVVEEVPTEEVPTGAPPEAVAPKGPVGKVSDALTVPAGKLKPDVQGTLDAIDKVHGADKLPTIPIKSSSSKKNNGSYNYKQDPATGEWVPGKIMVNRKAPHPRITTAHEIGHYLDHVKAVNFTSPEYKAWQAAIQDSSAIKHMDGLYHKDTVPMFDKGKLIQWRPDKKYIHYTQRPQEQFARSYSQWIATKSGDTTMLSELDDIRRSKVYQTQWSDDDFEPISKAMDDLFAAEGLLR